MSVLLWLVVGSLPAMGGFHYKMSDDIPVTVPAPPPPVNAGTAPPLYQQLLNDITHKLEEEKKAAGSPCLKYNCANAHNSCGDGTCVMCCGKIQAVAFNSEFNWGDINAIHSCQNQGEACLAKQLTSQVTGLGEEIQLIGKTPLMVEGEVYCNHGKAPDSDDFTYNQEEDSTFTMEVDTGLSMSYSFEVKEGFIFESAKETFTMKVDLTQKETKTIVRKKSWSDTQHVTLPGESKTNFTCFVMGNSYGSNYTMNLIPNGPILHVVWNPRGTAQHPYFVYTPAGGSNAKVPYFVKSYVYKGDIGGAMGSQIICDKQVHPLHAHMNCTKSVGRS